MAVITPTALNWKVRTEELIALSLSQPERTPAECWKLVNPASTATPASARVLFNRAVARYAAEYPDEYEMIARRAHREFHKKLNIDFLQRPRNRSGSSHN